MENVVQCESGHRKLLHPKRFHLGGIQWPSFVGVAQLVGKSASGKVTVYVDPTLGAPALKNAQDLLAGADAVVSANDAIFGTTSGAVNVIVFALGGATDGTGGADHGGCDALTGGNIECCAAFGQSDRVLALFEAELSENSMGGNLCGESTGEALSRWCASVNPPGNALGDFASGPSWVQAGMPNWVDATEGTDQNYPSIGCGMVFLSWLQSLGYPLSKIAPAMVSLGDSGTLAQLYGKLTGQVNSPWTAFQNAIAALPGGAAGIKDDDPFKGATPVPPVPPNPPVPPTPPGGIIAMVDAFFASVEAKFAGHLLIVHFLMLANKMIDQWLQAGGVTLALGGLQQVIDAALDALIASSTGIQKIILTIVKSVVDSILAKIPAEKFMALTTPIPADLEAALQAVVNDHVAVASDTTNVAQAQATLTGLQAALAGDQATLSSDTAKFNALLAAYLGT